MTYRITLQNASKNRAVPKAALLKQWAKMVLQSEKPAAEVTVRIVEKEESQHLNQTYRHKNKPTNILSFPAILPPGRKNKIEPLGDIIICADLVEEEARAQGKDQTAHWAHLIVHGHLHLLGYDHETESEAAAMEAKEISVLNALGFSNPYAMNQKVEDNE